MPCKLILGCQPWLALAQDQWAQVEPDTELILHPVALDASYQFDFGALSAFDPQTCTAFVAWSSDFLNFQRLELMGEFKKRGFKMPPLCSPHAVISASATIQENAWIQPLAIVGPGAVIGVNACVGMGARVGAASRIGKSVWLGENVRIGSACTVESHAVLGAGVEVVDGIRIGRQACIERPDRIDADWPDYAFRWLRSDLDGTIVDYSRATPAA